jgi:DnaJ-class molecular chaperone
MMMMNIDRASTILGINPPIPIEKLMQIYRAKAQELHPDKESGSHEKFLELKQAFDLFRTLVRDERSYDSTVYTTNGIALHTLGKGLGNKNGLTCTDCEGRGYNSYPKHKYSDCPHCKGHGNICCDCSGTGKFIQKNTKREVSCKTCEGQGFISDITPYINWRKFQRSMCIHCWGSGRGYYETTELAHEFCHKCKGTGETEMWNPVLQKLAILKERLK